MKTYTINDRYSWKKLEDKILVLDTHTGDYFVLNGSGSVIFHGLMQNKSIDEISQDLCNLYMVLHDDACADIYEFIDQLVGDGIILSNQYKGG